MYYTCVSVNRGGGGGVPQSQVPGPFWGRGRGMGRGTQSVVTPSIWSQVLSGERYPSLWSQVLSRGYPWTAPIEGTSLPKEDRGTS